MDRRAELKLLAQEHRVPAHLVDGLANYAIEHLPTGGFLRAVLSNDLYMAVQRADSRSYAGLLPIIRFIVTYLPSSSYGSEEAVDEWLAQRRVEPGDGPSSD